MKKHLFFIALVIIFSISTTFATTIHRQINVYYNDIKIKVEQEEIDLLKKVFVFEGHIYVPLRYFSEALGYNLEWDSLNRTATLNRDLLPPCNPLIGEYFVYGQITKLNYDTRFLTLEQHLDNNSRDIYDKVRVSNEVEVLLQRKDKEFKIEFMDVKVGDVVGLIFNKDNEIRGIIVFT